MSRRIFDTPFADLLPESIRHDSGIAAAAAALDPALRQLVLEVPNLLLFSRLDSAPGQLSPVMQRLTDAAGGLKPLSEQELELLAWQFHVDFRDAARTPAELAEMVRESIPWHRIKGTPASVIRALKLFGIEGTLEEHIPGIHWATCQLGIRGLAHAAELGTIVKVVRETAPVRCRLSRVYNAEYDRRHWIWTPQSVYGEHHWSFQSGFTDPETGLVVSLGQKSSAFAGPLSPFVLALRSELSGSLARLTRHWIWAYARWSEVFPVPHGIASGQIAGAEVLRVEAPFRFRARRVARGQIGWSGAELSGQPAPALHLSDQPACPDRAKAQWADVNARWGLGRYILTDTPPRWGASRWGDRTGRREVVPLERFTAVQRALAPYLGSMVAGSVTLHGCGHTAAVYPENHWRGPWDTRKWNPYYIPTKSTPQRKTGCFWGGTVWGNAVWQ